MAFPPNQMSQSRAFVGGDPIDELAAIRANKGESLQPVEPMQGQGQGQGTGIPGNMPVFVPEQTPSPPKASLHDDLQKVGKLAAANLAERAISPSIIEEAEETERMALEQQQDLQKIAMNNAAIQRLSQSAMNPAMARQDRGLISMAAGGEFAGRVPGEGHGMEDNVRMPIKEDGRDVATLAVSPSEYVVDSHTMAALGNGNADRGADVMDETVKQIRQKAYGSDKQPREISGLAALKPLIERV
jgi:hypothetical protein